MLKNLLAEMAREGLTNKDIAGAIGKDVKSVSNKLHCKTEFTRREMVQIKQKFFPRQSLDYLFEQTEK